MSFAVPSMPTPPWLPDHNPAPCAAVAPCPFRLPRGAAEEPAAPRVPAGGAGSGQHLCHGGWLGNLHGQVPGEAVLPHSLPGQHDHW